MTLRMFSIRLGLIALLVPAATSSDAAQLSPTEVTGTRTVSVQEARKLFDGEVLFVDVRKDSDWEAGRIPGAEHLELKKGFTAQSLASLADKDQPVVIYCNGPKCLRSSKACAKAVDWGFKKVAYFRDGFPAWRKAGYPIE